MASLGSQLTINQAMEFINRLGMFGKFTKEMIERFLREDHNLAQWCLLVPPILEQFKVEVDGKTKCFGLLSYHQTILLACVSAHIELNRWRWATAEEVRCFYIQDKNAGGVAYVEKDSVIVTHDGITLTHHRFYTLLTFADHLRFAVIITE